jgi:methylated-DNA-protein-cysteine methyltransferase-like protein
LAPTLTPRPSFYAVPSSPASGTAFEQAVVRAMRELQPGEVVSYGELARRAGFPRRARGVGNVLASHRGDDLPWWRVVRADGRLAAPSAGRQRRLLEDEGVDVERGRVRGGVP